jgi:cell division protein FtsI (penicillin-binding protein 3)
MKVRRIIRTGVETAEVNGNADDVAKPPSAVPSPATADRATNVVRAAMREPVVSTAPANQGRNPEPPPQPQVPSSGTVVLDVEQGGIEVPTFVGKTFRGAVEAAQDAGLELEAVGSGVARQQSPLAGSHVPAGSRVTVQFGR